MNKCKSLHCISQETDESLLYVTLIAILYRCHPAEYNDHFRF